MARVSSDEAAGTTQIAIRGRRGCQARGLMVIDTRLPDFLTCARIERDTHPS